MAIIHQWYVIILIFIFWRTGHWFGNLGALEFPSHLFCQTIVNPAKVIPYSDSSCFPSFKRPSFTLEVLSVKSVNSAG